MIKSFLILMLVATQFLAGTEASFFLCICEDGSFCCIDLGPSACDCCHKGDLTANGSHSHGASCSAEGAIGNCGHRHDLSASAEEDGCLWKAACDCTHIPVLLASKHSNTVARSSITVDATRWCSPFVSESVSNYDIDALNGVRHTYADAPSPAPDFLLVVVSTIVIRC